MAKASFPSIFYVYGNKTYEEEIQQEIEKITASFTPLNISNPNGCGFKLESFDIGDMKNLDINLERFEAWIQQTRRTEFTDLDTNLIDLDKFIIGCNNRITGLVNNDLNWIKFKLNSHRDIVAFRSINFMGTAAAGSYEIDMGGDKISAAIPMNTAVTNTTIIKKNLAGEAFDLTLTDCNLAGYIIEYKGQEMYNYDGGLDDLTGADGLFNTSTGFFVIGSTDGWWKTFWLTLPAETTIKSFNLCFGLRNTVAPPKTIGLWAQGYLKGVHQGYIHTNGINGTDDYTATEPITYYYINYPCSMKVDQIKFSFKTPVFNNLDNTVAFPNIMIGY